MKIYIFSSQNNLKSPRNAKDGHRDNHKETREQKQSSSTTTSQHPAANSNGASANDRAFKDKHHPLLIAIWNTDRTQTNVDEKLKGLRELVKKGTSMI